MHAAHRSLKAYSFGCALVWLIVLKIAAGADESKRRTIQLMCAGWWLGWRSETIARTGVFASALRGSVLPSVTVRPETDYLFGDADLNSAASSK